MDENSFTILNEARRLFSFALNADRKIEAEENVEIPSASAEKASGFPPVFNADRIIEVGENVEFPPMSAEQASVFPFASNVGYKLEAEEFEENKSSAAYISTFSSSFEQIDGCENSFDGCDFLMDCSQVHMDFGISHININIESSFFNEEVCVQDADEAGHFYGTSGVLLEESNRAVDLDAADTPESCSFYGTSGVFLEESDRAVDQHAADTPESCSFYGTSGVLLEESDRAVDQDAADTPESCSFYGTSGVFLEECDNAGDQDAADTPESCSFYGTSGVLLEECDNAGDQDAADTPESCSFYGTSGVLLEECDNAGDQDAADSREIDSMDDSPDVSRGEPDEAMALLESQLRLLREELNEDSSVLQKTLDLNPTQSSIARGLSYSRWLPAVRIRKEHCLAPEEGCMLFGKHPELGDEMHASVARKFEILEHRDFLARNELIKNAVERGLLIEEMVCRRQTAKRSDVYSELRGSLSLLSDCSDRKFQQFLGLARISTLLDIDHYYYSVSLSEIMDRAVCIFQEATGIVTPKKRKIDGNPPVRKIRRTSQSARVEMREKNGRFTSASFASAE